MFPPHAKTTMETIGNYREVKWAGIPVGVRIPVPGERCSKKAHKSEKCWRIEEYRTIGGIHTDKVCKVCGDRRILGKRPYPKGQAPNFNAQVAAAMRNHAS